MRELKTLAILKKDFNSTPKWSPIPWKNGARVSFFGHCDTLIFRITLMIGKRGGIQEELLVADLGNTRVSEQLIIRRQSYGSERETKPLLNLREIRKQIHSGKRPTEACQQAIKDFIKKINGGCGTSRALAETLRFMAQEERGHLFRGIVSGGATGLRR